MTIGNPGYLAARIARLCGTASALTIAAMTPAHGQAAAPVEEVLVTGSLIRGAEAVGVPVTALSAENFKQTGALTASELLRTIPAVTVDNSTAITNAGGQINRAQGIDVHTMNSSSSPRTLLLVNGMRVPPAGHGTDRFDPSIVPQIAVDRIDVLPDGASATYGSDAIAGVVNVVMKRGFDGAITQIRYGEATDGENGRALASQLYGRKWDSGDITLSYEWYDEKGIPGSKRARQFTMDYTPWGLDNTRLVSFDSPAVYSTGSPNNGALVSACTNCFSLPHGVGWNYGDTTAHTNPTAPGSVPTTTWAAIQANVGAAPNEKDAYFFSDVLAYEQRNAATVTFDQNVYTGVQLFADAFYQNRRVQQRYPVVTAPSRNISNLRAIPIPTSNPYYPSGAPTGLRLNYNISQELQPKLAANEVTGRWALGANVDLPYEWKGKLYYSYNQERNYANGYNLANNLNVSAALGNTVPSVAASGTIPGQAAFVKPANIPYLNVFCDPFAFKCNSQTTLDYISAFRLYQEHYNITEWGANFDGPLFQLPGGEVKAAVGANKYSHVYSFLITQNYTGNYSAALILPTPDDEKRNLWAAYGQLSIPLVGEMNAMPFLQRADLEVSFRHDHYDLFGSTDNPKIALNLTPIAGLTLRGDWGTSFRAPAFSDASAVGGAQVQPLNSPAGGSNVSPVCATGAITPAPGSAGAAIVAASGNTTCAGFAAVNGGSLFAGGLTARGGAGIAAPLRSGSFLQPEKAKNYSLGIQYQPMDNFLKGLNLDITYFHLKVDQLLQALDVSTTSLTDPNLAFQIVTPDNPNFAALVSAYVRNPRAEPIVESAVRFIADAAVRNTGYVETNGFDFSVGYDWDFGDPGVVSGGVDGTYFLHRKTQTIVGTPATEAYSGDSFACLFCSPPVPQRLRYRARLGWASADDAWNATLFVNYTGHYFSNQPTPPINLVPAYVTLDASFGYNTGNDPANTYLQNIDVRLVVNDLMNKYPPFMRKVTTGGSTQAAFDISQSPVGRSITVVLTKTW